MAQDAKKVYDALKTALETGKGCLIGRNGSTELQALNYLMQSEIAPNDLIFSLQRFSGIFPPCQDSVNEWKKTYLSSLAVAGTDPIVCGWFAPSAQFEKKIVRGPPISLRALEPYYVAPELRWTSLLAGKRVAVVSSFAKTISRQLEKTADVWGENAASLLPASAMWFPIQTGFPPSIAQGQCEWPATVNTWKLAISYLFNEVVKVKPDVCIIGCGGLSMILGAYLKKKGIACIVMGGATQVLFGIKGKRWASHDVISKFWNDAWVWPDELSETPGSAGKIEGGCYWR